MNQPLIKIAFAGEMRSGKDTCCDFLTSKTNVISLKFAAPLYEILEFAQYRCGLPGEKDRLFLQWIGTEWGRSKRESLWVDLLLNEAFDALNHGSGVVVSDARFNNEFEALKDQGFLLVKVVRPEESRNATEPGGLTQATTKHASEQDVRTYPDFDVVLENNGTLADLFIQLETLVQTHFLSHSILRSTHE